ncbi:MAG: GEVED domain-containing protein, partial [Psychrosphaera sp.]|nr:GEVED domain-containing protein [Psychrosphaera sp.]
NQTLLISKGFNGQAANGNAYDADVSDDGNFVVFTSNATNLLEQPTNATTSVFLYDRQADTITLVGKNANNEQIDSRADEPSISGDGRRIAYTTAATNLDVRDTNGRTDVYVYDSINNTTELVSVTLDNAAAGFSASSKPSLSYDGQFIAFRSSARNLVQVNWNNNADIFFRDMNSKTTTLISNSWDAGQTLNGNSDAPDLSPDGRYVTYTSQASNLVEHGHNSNNDGFIHDRLTGTTLLASKGNLGQSPAGNHVVMGVDRSANGRFFVFDSMAPNIVENDPNITLDHFLVDFDTNPVIAITAPGDNSTFVEDQLIAFTGSAQDQQDGDISANIQWSSDIDGALSSSTYLSVGTHVVSATITDTAGHTEQTAITLIIEEKAPEYCAASGIDSANQWIEQVEFASQQVQSGNNNGYLDNTGNAVIDLTKGENALKLTPGYSGKAYRKKWRVWIDINQDGTFTTDERIYNGRSRKTINSKLTIDSSALTGQTRMRVAMRWGKKPKACGTFEYGEVEDYTVNILP